LKKTLILLLVFSVYCFAQPMKKVLFGCKSGDFKSFEKSLDSMAHLSDYYSKNSFSYDIVMVAQSECVKFMLASTENTEYAKEEIPLDIELKMEKLKGKARFEQCAVTLSRKQIPSSKVRKSVKIVESATVATVDYQLNGYALIP